MFKVCAVCDGKGYRWRYKRREPCPNPDCRADRRSLALDQCNAKNALANCAWSYERGLTSIENLELAVKGCVDVNVTLDEMRKASGLSLERLRMLSSGQSQLI